jgi:hypothetical protein
VNVPERVAAELLRRSMALLPADRRMWAEAVSAETADIPAGPQRLIWLAGGLQLTIRQAVVSGGIWCRLAFAAAAGGVAWAAWSGSPSDPATVIDRVDVIALAVILAGFWTAHRIGGPVAGYRLARLARAGGYAAILALVLAKSAVERVADAPPNNLIGPAVAWTGEVVFLAVMGGYAAVILAYTAHRSPAAPGTLARGIAFGLTVGVVAYALGPLGFPLRFAGIWPAGLYDAAMASGVALAACAPVGVGWAVARRATPGSGVRQGAMAGLCTGTAAALAVTVLSTATIALLPYAAGLRGWAAGHVGHWTPVVGQVTSVEGPRVGYVAGNSAFAAGYLIVLLLSPLAGSALAAAGGWGTGRILPGPHHPPVTVEEPT